MPTDAFLDETLARRRGPAGFCQEQTQRRSDRYSLVKAWNVTHSMFNVTLSDKIPEAVFHGQDRFSQNRSGAAGCGKCRPHGNPLQSQRAPTVAWKPSAPTLPTASNGV